MNDGNVVMSKLLIIKTGCTIDSIQSDYGDFENWVQNGLGYSESEVQNVSVYLGESLPELNRITDISGVVITGSNAMVTDRENWSEITAAWLQQAIAANYPVLGICYGHQLIAHAMGGIVGYNPKGYEVGVIQIELAKEANNDVLFNNLKSPLFAYSVHAQTVIKLPENAVVLAQNERDNYQAFRLGEYCWGLQFHPEFNAEIMRRYIQAREISFSEHGYDIDQLLQNVMDCPDSQLVLRRFGDWVRQFRSK
jgi:GMP synthase (glutamine-hydrolysing)